MSLASCERCAQLSVERLLQLAQQDFSGNVFAKRAFYQHHASFTQLETAARSGCSFCNFILRWFKGSFVSDTIIDLSSWPKQFLGAECPAEDSMYSAMKEKPDSETDASICLNSSHVYTSDTLDKIKIFDTLMIQVGPIYEAEEGPDGDVKYPDEDEWGIPTLYLTLTAFGDKPVILDDKQFGRDPVDLDLGSDINMRLAQRWISDCHNTHDSCLSIGDHTSSQLPTRVIAIDPDKSNTTSVPTWIWETQGAKGRYVALSHCWGGLISPLLATETYKTFQKALPINDLPANFRDAINITRQLGLKYLWIDSLCIIQDSQQDWVRESQKMGQVYNEAFLTISAISSPGSKHGILTKDSRMDPRPEPTHIRAFADQNTTSSLSVTLKNIDEEDLRGLEMHGPLSTRGWCLQESVLSARILFFGAEQIYWRCPAGFKATNGLPTGNATPEAESLYEAASAVLSNRDMILSTSGNDAPSLPLTVPLKTRPRPEQILVDFYAMVRAYSGRRLSFPTDKLPAFSGLAQRLHRSLGGSYLAGLWSRDLLPGLLWYGDVRTARHVTTYRAPSLSWAVTDEPILFAFERVNFLPLPGQAVEILNLETTPKDKGNPYGEIVAGHLVLEALTMPLVRSHQVIRAHFPAGYIGSAIFDETEGAENMRPEDWTSSIL